MSKRKKIIICSAGAMVIIAAALIGLLFLTNPQDVDAHRTSGEAEAVMTTKPSMFDGIWDSLRHSDELYYPLGIIKVEDKIIVADSMNDRIQIIAGDRNTRVGRPGQYGLAYIDSGALVDGERENALFMKPSDIAAAPNGDIIICDTGNNVIRRMDEQFVITVAGNGESGYSNGTEREVTFNEPRSVAVDNDGIIYVSDTLNHCIRKIDTNGNVTLYAGTPERHGYRDGALSEAMFFEPCGLFLSSDGDLYVADSANHSIRRISGGMVSTVAGVPGDGESGSGYRSGDYTDGDIDEARFNFPRALTMLPNGSLIIADSMNHAIRMIKTDDSSEFTEVITLAGNGIAEQYYSSVENMKFTRPEGVYTDGEFLYVSDTFNNRVVGIPLTERVLAGRPSREQMLINTGITVDSKYAYRGDIRIFLGEQRIDMGRVQPWNTPEYIYIPIRPLFEALGADVELDEKEGILTIIIDGQSTFLTLNKDYFILKGVMVTTAREVERLFPYYFEWFPEFSLIALHIPDDLIRGEY
ncbi:MAG: stalk domain-containing protein [Oscillospiraceae bacterium]|nr:stalk domain-containing protein [Oscillospiraceae bacterium]